MDQIPPLATAQHDIPPIIIPDPPENPNPVSVYHMVTHFPVGSNWPIQRLSFHVSLVFPLPKSYRDAFRDSNWQNSMCDEYNALIKNQTWTLVPRPSDTNVVRCMWLFRYKFLTYGTLSRYKDRLVANGSTQLEGVDVDTESKLGDDGDLISDLTLYQSLADLVSYSDVDWADCPTTRQSTSGYCVFLGNNLIFWSFKRQPTLSLSSAEAECRGVANVVAKTCWLRNLLRELHTPLSSATLVYCDNVSALYLSSKLVQHQRTKHIEMIFILFEIWLRLVRFEFFMCRLAISMWTIFTKGLPSALFEEFRSSLSVRCPLALTAKEKVDNSLPEFTTFSNVLFDAEYESDSTDDQSCSDEDVLEKIVSKPLFEEEIIPIKIDLHHDNAESDLMESLHTHDSSLLISSKIDSLLDEFAGELALLKSIPPGIDETDYDFEEDIRLIEKLLYDNSSPRPPKEFVSANSDAEIKPFSPSPILVKDSDSLMEESDLFCTPDYPMPSGIEDDDYDSKRDILILKDLPSNNTLSFAEKESFYFVIPPFSRPPAKPPDCDTKILNIKMMGNIYDQKAFMHRLMITLASHQEKSPDLLSYRGLKAFQPSAKCPMMIHGQNNPILDVLLFYFYPP
nr:ribonuclease H-like domain-containing protein [Tanacetum cinerariifolium]